MATVVGETGPVGGFIRPADVDKYIEQKKAEVGEPPDDLEWGYMKD